MTIRPYEASKLGVSRKGEPGTEVGAVEYPPPDDCEEYDSPYGRGELPEARLTHDRVPLPAYGLLVALFLPICANEGEDEIR